MLQYVTYKGDQVNETKRITSKDDFELVSMRHRQFRRSTMPTEAKLKEVEPAIVRAAKRAHFRFRPVWEGASFDIEDLVSYGRVFTCMYLDSMTLEDPEQDKKLFQYHLNQRFGELAKTLNLKVGATYIPITRPVDPSQDLLTLIADSALTPEEQLVMQPAEEDIEVEATPINPKKLLRTRLAGLPTDVREKKLRSLMSSDDADVAAAAAYWQGAMATGSDESPEIREQVAKMVEACLAATPDIVKCPKCQLDKSKGEFGVRVPRKSKSDRTPVKAMLQSRCNGCR